MTSKILWLDVDGVLLDWVGPFLYYIESPLTYEELPQYDLSFLFNGDKQMMIDKINQFNKTPYYANLQPFIKKEDLQGLKDKGYELNVISQVDGNIQRMNRLDNLVKTFGPRMFTNIRLTKRGENKAEILRGLCPAGIITVVEDNPQFFRDAAKIGGFHSLAIRHTYNHKELKEFNGLPIYTGMSEVVRHLLTKEAI